jgi:hypothetical protein
MDNLDCKSLEVLEEHPSSEALLEVHHSMGVGRNLGAVDVAAIPFFEEADTLECGEGIRVAEEGIHHKLNWEDSPGAVQHLEACLDDLDVRLAPKYGEEVLHPGDLRGVQGDSCCSLGHQGAGTTNHNVLDRSFHYYCCCTSL